MDSPKFFTEEEAATGSAEVSAESLGLSPQSSQGADSLPASAARLPSSSRSALSTALPEERDGASSSSHSLPLRKASSRASEAPFKPPAAARHRDRDASARAEGRVETSPQGDGRCATPPCAATHSTHAARLTKRDDAVQAWIRVWAELGPAANFSREIERAKKQAVESRKRLASDTKEFRRLAGSAQVSEEQKLRSSDTLLRAYQQEIDSLTRRAKGAEATFLSLIQLLLQQPDLTGLLLGLQTDAAAALASAAASQQAALVDEEHQSQLLASLREETACREALERELQRLEEVARQQDRAREKLACENEALRQQIQDLESEFATLTNQAVTVRRLEEEREQNKRLFEQRVQTAVAEKEKHLRAQMGAKDQKQARLTELLKQTAQTLEERNLVLEGKVAEGQQQLIQLKAESEKRCAALQSEISVLNLQLEQAQREDANDKAFPSLAAEGSGFAPNARALEVAQQRIAALQQEERRLLERLKQVEKDKEAGERRWREESERLAKTHAQEVEELRRALRERPAEVGDPQAERSLSETEPWMESLAAPRDEKDDAPAAAALLQRLEELERRLQTSEKECQAREADLKAKLEEERRQHMEVVAALQRNAGECAVREGARGGGHADADQDQCGDGGDECGDEGKRKLPSMLQVVLSQREQYRLRVAALEEELEAVRARLIMQRQELLSPRCAAASAGETPAGLSSQGDPLSAASHAAPRFAGADGERDGAAFAFFAGAPRVDRETEEAQPPAAGFGAALLAVARGVARAAKHTAASVWGPPAERRRKGKRRRGERRQSRQRRGERGDWRALPAASPGDAAREGDGWRRDRACGRDEEAWLGGGFSSSRSDLSDSADAAALATSDEEDAKAAAMARAWSGQEDETRGGEGPRRREDGKRKRESEAGEFSVYGSSGVHSLSLLPVAFSASGGRRSSREGAAKETAFLNQLQTLSAAERIVLIWGRMLLSCRATRLFALFYFLLLHFLVVLILFYHADVQSRGAAERGGILDTDAPHAHYHYYLNE
ncbi:hypothetical protein BESB_027380 [Besnoitia besnoiti]|uniref:Protein CASP n=1 Tax=Besnoitia besnoiti TaxID=94643 RepID=A0A2A9M6P1_BESBE|nr:uncharacterized protein BESB_027380 [Besnoitia besnoiti]PFH31303.1 hypothetical protein BESB_027380 [Besnoitia besnoiti]